MVFCLTVIQLPIRVDVGEILWLLAIQFNISLALIIRCAQIFMDLIFVVEYYPRKLNPLENFFVHGSAFFTVFRPWSVLSH